MKPCVKCKAELPDTAGHCVYCGSKQADIAGHKNKSTMMGHPGMLGEILESGAKVPAQQSYQGHMTPTAMSVPPEERARLESIARAAGFAETAPQQAFDGTAPQPVYRVPQQQPYGAPQQQPYGAPQQQPYGAPQQQPYGAPQQQPYGAPQQQPYGAPQQQPFGGANIGIQNAQFGAAAHNQPYGRPGDNTYRDSLTEQVKPLRAPGLLGIVDEWDESLTTQLLVFGVLLIACFVAPWSVGGGKTAFAWSLLGSDAVPIAQKLVPILLAATGVFAVLMGAFKLRPSSRALAAAAIGLLPLVVHIAGSKPFQWQLPVGFLGLLLLVTGLVIRARHTDHLLGRILATVGVLAVLVIYLVPENEVIAITMLIDQISDAPGKAKVLPIVGLPYTGLVVGLLPLLLSVLALLVWIPGPGRAGTHILSWLNIFWGLVAGLVALFLGTEIITMLKSNLAGFIYLPLAGAAWMTLAVFGIAGVVAGQIEP